MRYREKSRMRHLIFFCSASLITLSIFESSIQVSLGMISATEQMIAAKI